MSRNELLTRSLEAMGREAVSPLPSDHRDALERRLRAVAAVAEPATQRDEDPAAWRRPGPFTAVRRAGRRLPAMAGATLVVVLLALAVLLPQQSPPGVQLTAAYDAVVELPDHTTVPAEAGLVVPDGAIIRTGPQGLVRYAGGSLGAEVVAVVRDGDVELVTDRPPPVTTPSAGSEPAPAGPGPAGRAAPSRPAPAEQPDPAEQPAAGRPAPADQPGAVRPITPGRPDAGVRPAPTVRPSPSPSASARPSPSPTARPSPSPSPTARPSPSASPRPAPSTAPAAPVPAPTMRCAPVTGAVDCRWEADPTAAITGFMLQRSVDDGTATAIFATRDPQVRGYTDRAVRAGVTYHYAVTVTTADGQRARSQTVRVHMPADADREPVRSEEGAAR